MFFTYIHLSLASLFVLFTHKYLSSVNLSFFLHDVSIFWLEHLYILHKLQRPAWKVRVLWCKTGIYSLNLSEKVCLMCEDSFSMPLLCNLKYKASILSIIARKAPASSWSPSELFLCLKIDPQCFGPFGKFQDTEEILCTDYLSVSYDYDKTVYKQSVCTCCFKNALWCFFH